MQLYVDDIIPHVGIEVDSSLIFHFLRDAVLTFIFWQIGYHDFQAAFVTMLASGFFETGNGICYNYDGTHGHFDLLDLLTSVIAGFLIVSLLAVNFDFFILLNLSIIYASVAVVLVVLNKLLKRKFIFRR